ncbi:MAG: tetratricopeptide repeat protein, partial [Kangiellaceae bacterium]|nr:tetratricopeptide repeat protein [Kangiellaceae bacterium]
MFRVIMIPLCVASLISCSSGGQQTLADLRYEKKKEKPIEFEKMDYQQVRKEYQELLTLFKDDELKEQIERRIAEVYMLEGGEKQLKETKVKSYYAEAIRSYQEILEKYPNSPDNADVLYQLARAYELDGHIDKELKMLEQLTSRHPNYKNNSEARFRMGEIYYSDQKYAKAQVEYKLVALSQDPKLLKYAFYMLGWTQYKQTKFEHSVEAFAKVLNLLLKTHDEIGDIDKTDQPLVKDTIASMSLALARNGGAEVIERTQSLLGKPYLWLIYDSLGEYYLKKERYEDSAETFRQYVQRYNFSAKAPDLHSKLISTYINGGFPLQALKEKEVYVSFYGLASEYAKSNGGINDTVKGQLKVYYDELARHYHSKAQSLEKNYSKLAESQSSKDNSKKLQKVQANMYAAFEKAANFYHQFVTTFPADKKVPEFTFLQAEAYYSAKKYTQAIKLFERAAYHLGQFNDNQYRSKAGYAAIISYQNLIKKLTQEKQDTATWQAKAVDSMLKFAQVFHQDKRSPAVLTNAAEYLFGLQEYQRALEVSQNLIKAHPNLAQKLKKTAYGIAAHSHFKLGQLERAEIN